MIKGSCEIASVTLAANGIRSTASACPAGTALASPWSNGSAGGGSGASGKVNSGANGQLGYYSSSGTTISGTTIGGDCTFAAPSGTVSPPARTKPHARTPSPAFISQATNPSPSAEIPESQR